MMQLPNNTVETLVRCLPQIISRLDLGALDTRTYNAVRLANKAIRRMEKAIKEKRDERKGNDEDDAGAV